MQKFSTGKKRNCLQSGIRICLMLVIYLISSFNISELYAATINVTNNGDAGAGSLRFAIDTANANADPSNIININLGVNQTITLNSNLSPNSKTLTITSGTLVANNALNALGTGALTLNGGILESGLNTATLGNSNFNVTANSTIGGTNNLTITNGGVLTGTLSVTNTAITRLNSAMTGAGGLQITAGMTILGSANTYSGNTNVTNATLLAGGNNIFSPNSAVTLANGVLNLGGFNETIGSLAESGVVILPGNLTTGGNNTSTTYTGVITGPGSLIKNGTGTFTITGPNNYSGGTLVNNGVLQGTTTSLQGMVINNAQVTFNQGFNGTYAGNMNGTGAVNINGGGITFVGNNTYSGGTNINSGTLNIGTVNALPPNGNIAVNNSGVLNVGALTLNTTGNYTQGANAGFAATLIDQDNYGKLILNGSATLADGAFIYVTAGPNVNDNDLYDIITGSAPPSVNVNLLRILPANDRFRYRASITGNSLRLQILESNYLSNLAVNDPNALAIAMTLDNVDSFLPFSSDLFRVIRALDQLEPNLVLAALQSLEPDITTGPQITTRGIAEMAFQEIDNRLDYLRDRRHASAYDMRAAAHQLKRGYKAGDPWNAAANEQCEDDVNGSLGPFIIGNKIKQITRGYQFGYDAQTGGVGYIEDVAVADNTCLQLDHGRIGVGGTYTGSSVRSKNPNGCKTNIMSPQLLAYGYAEKSFFFSDIAVGVSRNWYEEERFINFGSINRRASAKYTGMQYGGRVRGGYCLARDLFETTPMAILQYTRLNLSSYTEKGADSINLMVQDQKFSSMRGGLGVRIAYTADKCNFLPELRVFYFRDLNEPKIDLTGQFTGGGAAFKQHNPILSRNSLVFGFGFTTHLNTPIIKDFYLSMNFDGERKENYKDYSGRASVWWVFD